MYWIDAMPFSTPDLEHQPRLLALRQGEAAEAAAVRVEHLDPRLAARRVGDHEAAVRRVEVERGGIEDAPRLGADVDDLRRRVARDRVDRVRAPIEDEVAARCRTAGTRAGRGTSRRCAPEARRWIAESRCAAAEAGCRGGCRLIPAATSARMCTRSSPTLQSRAVLNTWRCPGWPSARPPTAAGSLPRGRGSRRPACRARRRAAPARRGTRTARRRCARRARRRSRT